MFSLKYKLSLLATKLTAIIVLTTPLASYAQSSESLEQVKISSGEFYHKWAGHEVAYLERLLRTINSNDPSRHIVYLAGDSSLDNKAWVHLDPWSPENPGRYLPLLNGYDEVFENRERDEYRNERIGLQQRLNLPLEEEQVTVSPMPTWVSPDVTYHLNSFLQGTNYVAINTAVEASTLAGRHDALLPQDQFIHDNISNNDVLIVSIGGNDIALRPTKTTVFNLAKLIYLNSLDTLQNHPEDAWGFNHLKNLFGKEVKEYVMRLIGEKRPKKIIICTIYYPYEKAGESWADRPLSLLSYDTNPAKLQTVIRQIFSKATSKIEIPGSEVIPLPLFKILDGKDPDDYRARVEPSDQGGRKMAEEFARVIVLE